MFSDRRAGEQAKQAWLRATTGDDDDTTTATTTTTFPSTTTFPTTQRRRQTTTDRDITTSPTHHPPNRQHTAAAATDAAAAPTAGDRPAQRSSPASDRRTYADAAATGAAAPRPARRASQPQQRQRQQAPAGDDPRPARTAHPPAGSAATDAARRHRTVASPSPRPRRAAGTADATVRPRTGGPRRDSGADTGAAAPAHTVSTSPPARLEAVRARPSPRSGRLLTPEQISRVVAGMAATTTAATTARQARQRPGDTVAGTTATAAAPAAATAATASATAAPRQAAAAAAAAPSGSKFRMPAAASGGRRAAGGTAAGGGAAAATGAAVADKPPTAWRARRPPPAEAAGAAAAAGAARQQRGAEQRSSATRSGSPTDSDDDTDEHQSSTSEAQSESDSSDSECGFVSGTCAECGKEVAKDDSGVLCDMPGCRGLKCDACTRDRKAWWWCATHAAPPPGTTPTLRQLPAVLSSAAKTSVEAALEALGDWRADADMRALAEDLEDTISYGSNCKGAGAIRRLAEFIRNLPRTLREGPVSQGTLDFTLASYVGARCRTARRSRRPREWKGSRPVPTSVGGETNALVGLARVAGILPGAPQGSIPRTRRALRVHGCMRKLDASPRAYTFHWELSAARRFCNTPQAVAVWSLCVVALYFLLRPRYARAAGAKNLTRSTGDQYAFYLDSGDKTNQPRRMPCTSSSSSSDDDGGDGRPRARARARAPKPEAGLPAAHPRYTVAAGAMLHRAMTEWSVVRGAVEGDQPWFCRIEPARQTARVPSGARATKVGGESCWLWPNTPLSPEVIKRNLVAFLTPVIGATRAKLRVLSGLRGGGETEHALRKVDPHVRATIGWWKIRRLKEVGAMVGYEGCSVEEMVEATRGLGSRYIRYITPGVYTTTPPLSRSTRNRRIFPRISNGV